MGVMLLNYYAVCEYGLLWAMVIGLEINYTQTLSSHNMVSLHTRSESQGFRHWWFRQAVLTNGVSEQSMSIRRNVPKKYISVDQNCPYTLNMYEPWWLVQRQLSIIDCTASAPISVAESVPLIHTYIKSGMHIGIGQSCLWERNAGWVWG